MVNTTVITGVLRDASGVILPNTMVQFTRPGPAAQDGAVITSKPVSATSDASGVISVNLYTGNYDAKIMLSPYPEQFKLPVPPPTGLPVDWSGLVNSAPTVVTPDAVIDAQAARDAALAAALQATQDAAITTADRLQTTQDAAATAADRLQTTADAAATAADRLQTTQDKMDAAASAAAAALAAGYGPIIKNDNILSGNLMLPAGFNGQSVGPIKIAAGVILTISDGSVWAVV